MKKPIVFLVVGHANWGKSLTISALTGGRRGRVQLLGDPFFIRRMSNDDPPVSKYRAFILRRDPTVDPLVVAPYCPETNPASPLLRAWDAGYTLSFWVLRDDYYGRWRITPAEIARLRRRGPVRIFSGSRIEASARARALRRFIDTQL